MEVFEKMMVKTEEEIHYIKISSLIVGKALAEVARHIRPGITTLELDRIAEEFIRDHGARPAFKGYEGYPATLCVSLNEQVVHGIPGKREIKEGDIVSIDCGAVKDHFYGDSAYTFAVGDVPEDALMLMKRTKEALYKGIEAAVAGKRVGDVGFAVQNWVEQYGYSVVRDLVGHGIGRNLHEKPEVPNYGQRGTGIKLVERMTICIEPMINLGTRSVIQEQDGWTIRTADRKSSAHYEHAVAIRKDGCELLSTFEFIEEVVNQHIFRN